jgi:hypothetical protein
VTSVAGNVTFTKNATLDGDRENSPFDLKINGDGNHKVSFLAMVGRVYPLRNIIVEVSDSSKFVVADYFFIADRMALHTWKSGEVQKFVLSAVSNVPPVLKLDPHDLSNPITPGNRIQIVTGTIGLGPGANQELGANLHITVTWADGTVSDSTLKAQWADQSGDFVINAGDSILLDFGADSTPGMWKKEKGNGNGAVRLELRHQYSVAYLTQQAVANKGVSAKVTVANDWTIQVGSMVSAPKPPVPPNQTSADSETNLTAGAFGTTTTVTFAPPAMAEAPPPPVVPPPSSTLPIQVAKAVEIALVRTEVQTVTELQAFLMPEEGEPDQTTPQLKVQVGAEGAAGALEKLLKELRTGRYPDGTYQVFQKDPQGASRRVAQPRKSGIEIIDKKSPEVLPGSNPVQEPAGKQTKSPTADPAPRSIAAPTEREPKAEAASAGHQAAEGSAPVMSWDAEAAATDGGTDHAQPRDLSGLERLRGPLAAAAVMAVGGLRNGSVRSGWRRRVDAALARAGDSSFTLAARLRRRLRNKD